MIFLGKTRKGHHKRDGHWNCFKRIRETSESWGWSAYRLFQAHRYHLGLNLIVDYQQMTYSLSIWPGHINTEYDACDAVPQWRVDLRGGQALLCWDEQWGSNTSKAGSGIRTALKQKQQAPALFSIVGVRRNADCCFAHCINVVEGEDISAHTVFFLTVIYNIYYIHSVAQWKRWWKPV